MTDERKDRDRSKDPERRPPRSLREQDPSEPERPRRPAEDAGVAPHQLEDPPQAEGDRDQD